MTYEIGFLFIAICIMAAYGFFLNQWQKRKKQRTSSISGLKYDTLHLVYERNGNRIYANVEKAFIVRDYECTVSFVPYGHVDFEIGKPPHIKISTGLEIKVITESGEFFHRYM